MTKHLGKNRHVGEGNTGTPTCQPTRKTFYSFTVFNYEEIEIELNRQLETLCKKYLYGHEICPDTGRKHLQGFMHLKKPMRITELKLIGNPHFEACKGNEEQNAKYCTKENNNIIRYGYPEEIILIKELPCWTCNLFEEIKLQPDFRKVWWYWSDGGCMYKSAVTKVLVVNHNAIPAVSGKYNDIINLIFNADMTKSKIIVFDLPRNHGNSVSYSAIESIKNGLVVNMKYETGYKVFNPPHVIVFANSPPDESKLSSDRWNIVKID